MIMRKPIYEFMRQAQRDGLAPIHYAKIREEFGVSLPRESLGNTSKEALVDEKYEEAAQLVCALGSLMSFDVVYSVGNRKYKLRSVSEVDVPRSLVFPREARE